MKKEEANISGLTVVSLAFGILSLFLGWVPVIGWIFIILTLVLSSKSIKSITNDRNLRLAKAARILGYVSLAIAVLTLVYIFGISGHNMSIGPASNMSAVPGQLLSMQYQGTDWSGKDYLRFYDDKGFSVTVTPVPVPGGSYFLFIVPAYFEFVDRLAVIALVEYRVLFLPDLCLRYYL